MPPRIALFDAYALLPQMCRPGRWPAGVHVATCAPCWNMRASHCSVLMMSTGRPPGPSSQRAPSHDGNDDNDMRPPTARRTRRTRAGSDGLWFGCMTTGNRRPSVLVNPVIDVLVGAGVLAMLLAFVPFILDEAAFIGLTLLFGVSWLRAWRYAPRALALSAVVAALVVLGVALLGDDQGDV